MCEVAVKCWTQPSWWWSKGKIKIATWETFPIKRWINAINSLLDTSHVDQHVHLAYTPSMFSPQSTLHKCLTPASGLTFMTSMNRTSRRFNGPNLLSNPRRLFDAPVGLRHGAWCLMPVTTCSLGSAPVSLCCPSHNGSVDMCGCIFDVVQALLLDSTWASRSISSSSHSFDLF